MIGLLMGTAPPTSAGVDVSRFDTTKIEPSLKQAITRNPFKKYEVIVQANPARSSGEWRTGQAELAQRIVERFGGGEGGRIRLQLGMVNGFAVELTGAHILFLAQLPIIKSISGDHPVKMPAPVVEAAAVKAAAADPNLKSMETLVANAPSVWADRANQGQGVTVAVLDSGIAPSVDLPTAAFGVDTATGTTALGDRGGHGTHVAGIVAGNGAALGGKYKGTARACG